ncbi:hypothetical protein PG995_012528 [Apiospora arundinis]
MKANRDTPSNGAGILATSSTIFGLSCIVVLLRSYVRHCMLKTFKLDDSLAALALATSAVGMVCFVEEVKCGAGHMSYDISADGYKCLAKWELVHGTVNVVTISLAKLSMAFFLLRFMPPRTWYRRVVIFIIAFLVATDLALVILPIPIIVKLQVNRRTKMALFAIVGLGTFAVVASCMRIVETYNRFKPRGTYDYTFLLWFNAKGHVAILTSLPTLRPLFSRFFRVVSQASGAHYPRRPSYDVYGQSYPTRRRYTRHDDDIELNNRPGSIVHITSDSNATSELTADENNDDGKIPIEVPSGGIRKTTELSIQEHWT